MSASASARPLTDCWQSSQRARVLKLHQDAQRLLEPLAVVNPYARR